MKSFIPFIVIGICIALYYVYMGPTYSTISDLQTQKSGYVAALANIDQLKTHRDAILAQYNSIAPGDIAKLEKVVPDTTNSVDVVSNINAIAAQYGMTIRQVKITQSQTVTRTAVDAAAAPQSPFQTSTVSFSVSGPYPQFILFLKDLESNVHLFDVNSLNIALNQKLSTAGVFDYSVGLDTYSLH